MSKENIEESPNLRYVAVLSKAARQLVEDSDESIGKSLKLEYADVLRIHATDIIGGKSDLGIPPPPNRTPSGIYGSTDNL